jgi:4-carboxymuconolactone decarboxylase
MIIRILAMPRLPKLSSNALTPDQKRVYDNITNGPRGLVRGPFSALLHHPRITEDVQAMGINLRFNGILPGRLRELAILTTAHYWNAEYEWGSHVPIAKKEGLSSAVISAIKNNQPPDFPNDDEKTIHRFCWELHEKHAVSSATYDATTAILGHDGVVELTALNGYYTIISMILNTFQVSAPNVEGEIS